MSARTASRNPPATHRNPVILDDSDPSLPLLDSAHLDAIRADYDLEAESYLRALATKHRERLDALRRSFDAALAALDDHVRNMSLQRFVDDFAADPHRAVKAIVGEQMHRAPMTHAEQSVRKRKRVLATSPRTNPDGDDDPDAFFATTSKKARSGTASATGGGGGGLLFSSAAKGGRGKGPAGSVSRSASTRSKRNGMSPTSNRKPRLRLRPSTSTSTLASSSSVYRANPLLPPTPAAHVAPLTATARRPKRGESIVMRSMNGSPLGEFIASEEDDDDDEGEESSSSSSEEEEDSEADGQEGGDDEDDDEWDLLERNEASKVEHQSASKSRKNKKDKKDKGKAGQRAQPSTSASSHTQPPTAASFAVALPTHAPSYDALKARWKDEMRARLLKADVSDAERKRLEEVLMASMGDL